MVVDGALRTRGVAQDQRKGAGAGELHLHDVVVQIDVGQARHLLWIRCDAAGGALQEHLIENASTWVNDVGAELGGGPRSFGRHFQPDDGGRGGGVGHGVGYDGRVEPGMRRGDIGQGEGGGL